MAVQLDLLKQIHYFFDLSPAELESIKKFISEQKAEEDEVFLHEGDRSSFVYFVVSGVVKVYRSSLGGREQIVNMASPGESVNDVSVFDGNPTAANMLAMTPVTLYRIKKTDLKAILQKYPQVAMNALKVLAGRVRRDSALVKDLSFTQVTGRLAKMLLRYFAGADTDAWPRLTQQDMAAIVGATREVVNRSLRDMEEKGAIRLERRGIVIINKAALEEMMKSS